MTTDDGKFWLDPTFAPYYNLLISYLAYIERERGYVLMATRVFDGEKLMNFIPTIEPLSLLTMRDPDKVIWRALTVLKALGMPAEDIDKLANAPSPLPTYPGLE